MQRPLKRLDDDSSVLNPLKRKCESLIYGRLAGSGWMHVYYCVSQRVANHVYDRVYDRICRCVSDRGAARAEST